MKKLIIAVLAASGATVVHAQAETTDQHSHGGELCAEMRALIAGEGLSLEDLTRLMQERSEARFAMLDADKDGVVNLAEFLATTDQRSQARFKRMEPNDAGVVTRAGREKSREGRGHPGTENRRDRSAQTPEQKAEWLSARADKQFSRLDADGDGSISPEEFRAGIEARGERFAEGRKGRMERHQRRVQRNGEVPAEVREMRAEFRAMLREGVDIEKFSEFMRRQATVRFEALDANGDGELSADEFTAQIADRAERFFARMDSNHDGKVTGKDHLRRGWRGGANKQGD